MLSVAIFIGLSRTKTPLQGLYVSKAYTYLSESIQSWESANVPIFIKAMKATDMPEFKIHVRKFKPTATWSGTVAYAGWHDGRWKRMPLVFTEPYGIPYTEYVDCQRLEIWGRESYKQKMMRNGDVAGRALLSAIALQDPLNFSQVRIPLPHRFN